MRTPRRSPKKSRLRRLLRATVALIVLVLVAVVATDVWVVGLARDRTTDVAHAPQAAVIVVLGASVLRDGSPSPMLADRLTATAALWHAGRAPQVLVSGDQDFEREYDEVGVMTRELVAAGVPSSAIVEDPHGLRTLDSMCRAREAFGFETALVVTNGFHVPRAVYLGRHFGIDVHGVVADPDVPRPLASRVRNIGREVLARVLAVVDCELLGTRPEFDPRDGSQPR